MPGIAIITKRNGEVNTARTYKHFSTTINHDNKYIIDKVYYKWMQTLTTWVVFLKKNIFCYNSPPYFGITFIFKYSALKFRNFI